MAQWRGLAEYRGTCRTTCSGLSLRQIRKTPRKGRFAYLAEREVVDEPLRFDKIVRNNFGQP
jgi:hypothetical protein